jgi:hypothetical protein
MRAPRRVWLILGLGAFAVACGKKGPPLPPLRHNPMPVTDVHVGQQGGDLVVSYQIPTTSVDATKLDEAEAELLIAAGAGKDAKKLAAPRVAAKPGERRTDTLPLPGPVDTALSVRVRVRSHGAWSGATLPIVFHVREQPVAPASVKAANDPAGVLVSWTADTPSPAGTAGFVVRRRLDKGEAANLTTRPVPAPPYIDDAAEPGKTYCYSVRRVDSVEPLVASADSAESCLAVKDLRPPAAPTGLAALEREGSLEISWSPSPESDVKSYRVYRTDPGAQAPEQIAEKPAPERTYLDKPPRGTSRYTVTAVDNAGNESAHSNPVEGTRR